MKIQWGGTSAVYRLQERREGVYV